MNKKSPQKQRTLRMLFPIQKLSLRWRITILMGILVLLSSTLLTALSIQNATNNFVIPFVDSSSGGVDVSIQEGQELPDRLPMDGDPGDLPEGTFYKSEIKMDVKHAQRAFSLSSCLYMALITAGSMVAVYYLAGRALRPVFKLSNEMEQMTGATLSKRVSIPQTKDEIEKLSLSFNQLLERLEQEFEREKQFSSNVAHELKTPLATMMTSAQVLKLNDQTTTEEYRENLDTTLQSTRRLSQVVEGLLMLGRSDRALSFESVPLPALFRDIQQELAPLYAEKQITITNAFATEALVGNPLLLHRAFFNLVENAYKYTEAGGEIAITAKRDGAAIVVRIADTGIGIAAEDRAHIFEPFYRADKSRSRKIAGAGLGLSITKEILALHGAAITINARPEKGTLVEVRFTSGGKREQVPS